MAWIQYPRVTVETPLGTVQVAITDGDHAAVSTDAHVNDDRPTITYRGADYLPHIHLYASRGWQINPDTGYDSIKRRDNWSDAPRTYRDAIIGTVSEAVGAYLSKHPELLAQAEYADANNDADRLEAEATELSQKLADVRKQARRERKRQASAHAALARMS